MIRSLCQTETQRCGSVWIHQPVWGIVLGNKCLQDKRDGHRFWETSFSHLFPSSVENQPVDIYFISINVSGLSLMANSPSSIRWMYFEKKNLARLQGLHMDNTFMKIFLFYSMTFQTCMGLFTPKEPQKILSVLPTAKFTLLFWLKILCLDTEN